MPSPSKSAPRAVATFALSDLPYPARALEPHMSARTLEFHHGKHHRAYVDKANELVRGTEFESLPLEQALVETHRHGGPLFNNIAQIYNHNLFWHSLAPGGGGGAPPAGPLRELIEAGAGSFDAFKEAFVKTGVSQFGSGWVWLVADAGELEIVATANAETPLTEGKHPLLVCDVWEHAYYLDFQNRREAFLNVFLDKLVNWRFAAQRLAEHFAQTPAHA